MEFPVRYLIPLYRVTRRRRERKRERSSTGSLSREAVPKEAPGSLANGTFILVPRSFFLFHFGSGVRT